jgi:tRNA pseudouridine55 synthase
MNPTAKRKRVPVHGVLLLDKPAGISSTQALAKAKWLLNAEKAGHTGTLDPFATGLLPLCFGEATKFSSDLLDADKTYEATIRLGITTTTGDLEGEVIDTQPVNVNISQIELVLSRFRGPIDQIPPMYSALKRDGKPLYAYAREGKTLERESRAIIIHDLQLISLMLPELQIRVCCSKGTYVRALGEDIGKALGCGAHLTELRRTHSAQLSIDRAVPLDAIDKLDMADRASLLLPIDALVSTLPEVWLDDDLVRRFRHGQRLALVREQVGQIVPGTRVRVLGSADGFMGTAILSEANVLFPERVIS